jgi:predicted ribosome quality control (RQC) complex YloA/Tae2 family protein
MGKDKHENEDLIKYGLDDDVWFHVDNLSSAHVYLRLNHGEDWENIPEEFVIGMFLVSFFCLSINNHRLCPVDQGKLY